MIRPVAADGRIETGGAFTPIPRPRLIERIAAAAAQRVVLIVAPAGYGKSVALRQYLQTLAQDDVARFDMRPEHGSLLGFLRGFSESLTVIAPDARKTVSGAYEKNASSSTPGADLAMWMHAHIKSFSGVIAVDDLQLAESDPQIARFLVSLIERTKGRARWILSSRSALDLPVGSWLAYGEMDLGIDEHDLAFTIDEARQTAKAVRVSVRDEELEQILAMTSGWPTALSFALRSSTRSVDLRNIAASTREMVYLYLAEQVYNALTEEDRELLRLIAFLPEIDLDVLRCAGYPRAKARVESLRDRVAFIYPERPGVYRAHDLFAEFLRHELELQGDAAVNETRRRAARALEEAGRIAPALRVFAAAKAQDDVLRMLAQHGLALMEHAHGDAVGEALDALPQHIRSENTIAIALRGMRESDAGRFDRAQALFERAIAQCEDRALGASLALRLASLLFNQSRDIITLLEPVAADVVLSLDVRAEATSFLLPGYAFAGRLPQALAAMEEARRLAAMVDSDDVRARLYHRMGIAALTMELPPERATEYFGRAQAIAGESGLFVTAAAALGGLENVALLYEDDLTKSAWLAQQAMTAALKAGNRYSLQVALLQLIHIEMRRGTPERLSALEKQLATALTSDASRIYYVAHARAMLAAWSGRFDEAYRLLALSPDRSTYNFDRVYNAALIALYALGAGNREAALAACAKAGELLDAGGFEYLHGRRAAEIARGLCAIVEALAGRTTNAQRLLGPRALCEGAAVEAIRAAAFAVIRAMKQRTLIDEVTEALGGIHAAGYGGIALLLERVAERAAGDPVQAENPLTRAEIEVLEQLAEGSSPKEIAQATGRSVYTIQSHIQNVIKKLGCSGRTEALSVARRKHLININ